MIVRFVLALVLGFTPVFASARPLTNEEIDRRATEVPPGSPESEATYQDWLEKKQTAEQQKVARQCFDACVQAAHEKTGCGPRASNCFAYPSTASCIKTCRGY